MSDRFFPPPPPKRPSPESVRSEPASPRAKVVVTRPDAPLELEQTDVRNTKGKPKLTSDEVRALLAVHDAGQARASNSPLRRGRRIFVPLGLLCVLAHLVLGDWGWAVEIVLTLGALVWIALPLLRRSDLD